MKNNTASSMTASAIAWMCIVGTAQAQPNFAIGDGTGVSWTQAMNGIPEGRLRAVEASEGLTWASSQHYATQGTHVLRTSTLVPDFAYQGSQTLVAAWDPPDSTSLVVAAFDFAHAASSDYTGRLIQASLAVHDKNIWCSVELIDDTGRSRGWYLKRPDGGWGADGAQIDVLADGGAQGYGDNYRDQPGFNVRRVVKFRQDFSSNNTRHPPLAVVSDGRQWGATRSIMVVPAPSTLVVVAGAGLLASRRRRTFVG